MNTHESSFSIWHPSEVQRAFQLFAAINLSRFLSNLETELLGLLFNFYLPMIPLRTCMKKLTGSQIQIQCQYSRYL